MFSILSKAGFPQPVSGTRLVTETWLISVQITLTQGLYPRPGVYAIVVADLALFTLHAVLPWPIFGVEFVLLNRHVDEIWHGCRSRVTSHKHVTQLDSQSYMPPVKPQHVSGNVNQCVCIHIRGVQKVGIPMGAMGIPWEWE